MADALMDIIAKIPLTWRCCECGREFDNHPYAECPMARKARDVLSGNGYRREVVGEICRSCWEQSDG